MKVQRSIKYSIFFFMRVLLSGGLIIYLLSKVDVSQIASHWRGLNSLLLIITLPAIYLICMTLRAVRLRLILKTLNLELPLWWLCLAHLRGSFLKSFAPGGIAGDIYRSYLLARRTKQRLQSVAAILVEKAIGIASMVLLSVFSLLYGIYWIGYPVFGQLAFPILVGSGVLLAGGIIFIMAIQKGLIRQIPMRRRFWVRLEVLLSQISSFPSKNRNLPKLAVVSLLLQVSIVLWYFMIAISLEFHISFLVLLATIPLVELLLMLPISVGGIGIRDWAFTVLFIPFGLTVTEALSFSLLSFILTTVVTSLSGLAFLFKPPIPNVNILEDTRKREVFTLGEPKYALRTANKENI
jgi:uncharacterized protein (TIRG00374 family)